MVEYNFWHQRMIKLYGEPFLRYIFGAASDADVADVLADINPEQWTALQKITDSALTDSVDAIDVAMSAAGRFTNRPFAAHRTLAQQMRADTGITEETLAHDPDPLTDALLSIAYDVWPALLVKSDALEFAQALAFGSHSGVGSHYAMVDFCVAFMEDPELSQLFPDTPDIADIGSEEHFLMHYWGHWLVAGGNNTSVSLTRLPGSLIFSAALLCGNTGGPLSYRVLVPAIRDMVKILRRFASGDAVDVPVSTGLIGVQIEDESRYSFGADGELRRPTQFEVDAVFGSRAGVSVVLAGFMPIRLIQVFSRKENEGDAIMDFMMNRGMEIFAPFKDLEERVDRVRLSLLLASPDNEFLSTGVGAQFIGNLSDSSRTAEPAQQIPWAQGSTPQSVLEEGATVHKALVDHPAAQLQIAHRRILNAVSMRSDPGDSLIDAVVVWENAFGTTNEVSFRVSASMARLLEPVNLEHRRRIYKEVKKIYGVRSALVHGAEEPDYAKLSEARDKAVCYSIAILRSLYLEHPDLLRMKSVERSDQILLYG